MCLRILNFSWFLEINVVYILCISINIWWYWHFGHNGPWGFDASSLSLRLWYPNGLKCFPLQILYYKLFFGWVNVLDLLLAWSICWLLLWQFLLFVALLYLYKNISTKPSKIHIWGFFAFQSILITSFLRFWIVNPQIWSLSFFICISALIIYKSHKYFY